MGLIESLLSAIMRADGDALVMHVGEKPYVVSPAGRLELSQQALNLHAMLGMLAHLLPSELQRSLAELGAVEYELPPAPELPGQRFTVVAAGAGEDLWLEVRRHPGVAGGRSAPMPAASVAVDESGSGDRAAVPSAPAASPAAAGPPQQASPASPPPADELVSRTLRIEVPSSGTRSSADERLEALLARVAARGATALYLSSDQPPSVRVGEEVFALDDEAAWTPADIQAAVMTLGADDARAQDAGGGAVWTRRMDRVGAVRCSSFRDHRGPGLVLQPVTVRPLTAEQLDLGPAVEAFASEAGGLVLLASRPGQGKTTLAAGLLDLINRSRRDYVITLEQTVRVVHERRAALISQRELGSDAGADRARAEAALAEHPDVLVIDELTSPEMSVVAVNAAASGVLVLATIAAPTTVAAVQRLMDWLPAAERKVLHARLAECLLGIVTQVLLRRSGGGRVAARDVLVVSSTMAGVVADGHIEDLPLAIDSERRDGGSMGEALLELVRRGLVDAREAYRKADDREGLLAALRRENIDIVALERLG